MISEVIEYLIFMWCGVYVLLVLASIFDKWGGKK